MNDATRMLDFRDHSRASAGLTYVYPVLSRRAGGVSVGINLNPNNACNWRCIYCQVPNLHRGSAPAIDLDLLGRELRGFLHQAVSGKFMDERVPKDVRRIADIAISGNGEPTSARNFTDVVERVVGIMAEFALDPLTKVRLITNGSLLGRQGVQEGVRRLGACGGEVWFKVDAGTVEGFARINNVVMTPAQVVRNVRRCAALCATWVQTCMFAVAGMAPAESDIAAYLALLEAVGRNCLRGVLLYGLARPSMQPEASQLSPLSAAALEAVAERIRELGLTVRVSP
jgi:wyosine [tRNA(Phe)-imidazoG37] synthetase (radical SAM superfamily)